MNLLNLLPFINNASSKPKKEKDSFMTKLLKEDTNVSLKKNRTYRRTWLVERR